MSNQLLIEAYKHVLADSYTLYLKTQNFHWNVVGPHFRSLHQMFEEQYIDLRDAVDEIAERIRTLGAKAPGSYTAFSELAKIKEAAGEPDADEMVRILFNDQKTIIRCIKNAQKAAQEVGDEASFDLMVQRQQVHEKAAWMLRSSLPDATRSTLDSAA